VSRSQRVGAEDAHEVEVMYRLGAGLARGAAPPADASVLRTLLVDREALSAPAGADNAGSPQRSADGPIIVQAGPKWLATGVSAETQRAVFSALGADARIVAAPADGVGVYETTGIIPETFAGLRPWVEALASARSVVTVDTGAAHVAGMLGTPVVDVFPDAHFEAQVRRWRPWASPYRAFRASEVDGGAGSRFIEAVRDGF
jgi:hypothetical protein